MLTARVTEDNLLQAQWLHSRPSGAKAAFFLLVLMLVGLYLYDQAGVKPGILVGGFVGGVVGFAVYFVIILKYKCAKIYRQQKNLHIPYQFSWDNDGIYMKNEMAEGRMKWTDFTKHKENKTLFLLYHSDALFNIVPKSAFTNEQQLSEFSSSFGKIHG